MRGELGGGTCLPKSGYVRFVAKSKWEEGSCALFAKAKVDARERLEFTEGSTPRERCRSVTTADTRECLEILVFLFLVTPSLSLSFLHFVPPSLSLITLLGPQGKPPLSPAIVHILRRYINSRWKSERVGARVTFFESSWNDEWHRNSV